MNETYIPSGGPAGKLRRLAARQLARQPLQIVLNRALISFTFDDFPRSAAWTGADILERFGWRATYFAAAGYAGSQNHLGALFKPGDLLRLRTAGHEIGCHTYGHLDSGCAPVEAVMADCARNRRALAAMGHESDLGVFAFPYGEASPATKKALSQRYRALRGVQPGINRGHADRALLKAVPLDGGTAGLARALDAVRDAAANPGWLIFYGHDVSERPSQWGCAPDFLDEVCQLAADLSCRVMTMGDALTRIETPQAERVS